jgi:gas vesicle protein
MLPPIEFFMGVLAGGILGYLLAILLAAGPKSDTRHAEARHRTGDSCDLA